MAVVVVVILEHAQIAVVHGEEGFESGHIVASSCQESGLLFADQLGVGLLLHAGPQVVSRILLAGLLGIVFGHSVYSVTFCLTN